jgi:nucleoside-diphosphate-sugar epimerase
VNILLTGAASALGQALATGLKDQHQLRLSASTAIDTDGEFIRSDLGHEEEIDRLVAGIDTIVHLPNPAADHTDAAVWIDATTRCTYNLLTAAAAANVGQIILLSTLDLFLPYDADMVVNGTWRPLPSCEPAILGPHLSEFIAGEFAHTNALRLLIVRLGHVVRADEVKGQAFDPMWVDERDVVQAIANALEKDLPAYAIAHIQSDSPNARFRINTARDLLDYAPQFNFEEDA